MFLTREMSVEAAMSKLKLAHQIRDRDVLAAVGSKAPRRRIDDSPTDTILVLRGIAHIL
jgi:hypothetical protein